MENNLIIESVSEAKAVVLQTSWQSGNLKASATIVVTEWWNSFISIVVNTNPEWSITFPLTWTREAGMIAKALERKELGKTSSEMVEQAIRQHYKQV